MSNIEVKSQVATYTSVKFEENPNFGGGLLQIEWDGESSLPFTDGVHSLTAYYPKGMELTKRRHPLWVRLELEFEEAYRKFLGTIALVALSGAGFGTTLFVLALLLYLLGIFTGIEIIVIDNGV